MKKNIIAVLLLLLVHANSLAQIPDVTGREHTIIQSERQDGRFLSTYGVVHAMLANIKPECAFQPDMTAEEFREWQHKVRKSMQEIMKFPEVKDMSSPKRLYSKQCDGEMGILSFARVCLYLFSIDTRFSAATCSRYSMYPRFRWQ